MPRSHPTDKLVNTLLGVSIVLCVLLVSTRDASAQGHSWSHGFGSTGADQGTSVAVDASGNVLVTGHFSGFVDFGAGAIGSAGGDDIFIAKYNARGEQLWSHRFGDARRDGGSGIAAGVAGNVLVVGHFSGVVDFGGGPLESAGHTDIFVAKFDANGTHVWSRRFGGAGYDAGAGIALDASGNVFVTGSFAGNADFGGGPFTSAGDKDMFIAAYDGGGTHLWSRRVGGIDSDAGASIATGATGGVVVAGHFGDTVDFGDGSQRAVGGSDIFVTRYNAAGTHLWSRCAGHLDDDDGWSVTVDGNGGVVVAGSFAGTVDFGGGPLRSAGRRDIFVTKYDAAGAHVWSRRAGDVGDDDAWGVTTDDSRSALVTGRIHGAVSFGGEPLKSWGESSVFVAAYDEAGAPLSSACFGNRIAEGLGLVVGRDGSMVLTGDFAGSVDFGGGPMMSDGESDIFVAKFSAPPITLEPVASKKSARGGFTLLLDMGAGWQYNGFVDQSAVGFHSSFGIGGFTQDNGALIIRSSVTNVTLTRESGSEFVSQAVFVGLSGQGWINDRFTLEGGLGVGFLPTGKTYSSSWFWFSDTSEETRTGFALLVGGGYSFFQTGKSSFRVAFEYTPIFVESTHHLLSLSVGWQLL